MRDASALDRPWPLVGRESTLAELSSDLDDGRSVVLRAPAGAGKSRVLHELGARRVDRGDDVIRMSGVEATANLPLAPLLSLVPAEVATHPSHDIVRHALAEVYRRSAAGTVVLLVDDAHQLPDELGSFVHQVCSQELATVVIAARDTESLPEPLDALWRSGRARRVELAPLEFDHVSTLLETVLGGVVEPATVVRLWEVSKGHPLYLRELVAGAVQRGALATGEHGVWVAEGELVDGPRIAELIRSRLDALTTDELDVLVACAAQPNLPRRVVELFADRRAVASLFAHGLIEEVASGRRRELAPAHPLYAEVATALVDPERRRVVLGRLADAWEAVPGRRATDAAVLAELRLGAGAAVKADLLLEAARVPGVDPARSYELATLAEAGLDVERRAEAILERATALGRRREWREANALFEQAWSAARDELRPEVARQWISAIWDNERDIRAAIGLNERLAAAAGDDPSLADMLLLARMFSEPLDAVLPVALTRLRTPGSSEHQRAMGELYVATIQAHRGELADSLRRIRLAIDSGLLAPLDRVRAESILCDDLAWSGRIDEALAAAGELVRQARLDGEVDHEITMRHVCQTALALAGRAADAAVEGRRTLRLVAIAREVHVAPAVRADLALPLSMLDGARDEARGVLAELAALPPSARYLPASTAELAEAHLATTPEDRRAHLAAAAELARERDCGIHLARALYEHHRYGMAAGDDALVAELTDIAATMGGIAALWLREVVASASGDIDDLSAVSLAAARHGIDLLAVEAAARASRAAAHAGDGATAYVLRRRSERLSARVHRTRVAVTAPPSGLTGSEERVLERAIGGSTDREIARVLGVSLRTVHGHLHRSYGKLGLAGRDELAELLARHDPDPEADAPAARQFAASRRSASSV